MQTRLRQLQSLIKKLPEIQQQSLLDYAEFLVAKTNVSSEAKENLKPEAIERPPDESVVAAIKRLKQTYHMLDTDALLDQASTLMGQHILQGRDAPSVIDDLQALFQANYETYRQQC